MRTNANKLNKEAKTHDLLGHPVINRPRRGQPGGSWVIDGVYDRLAETP